MAKEQPLDRTVSLRGLSVADLEAFPDDGLRRELVTGVLFVSGTPTRRHQLSLSLIHRLLDDHVTTHGGLILLAPYEVRLSEVDSVRPDLVCVAAGHEDRTGEARMTAAPDVVVEVSSPSTRQLDLGDKRALHEREGVGEYWFVDLDADQLVVFRHQGDRFAAPLVVGHGETYRSSLLAGLAVTIDDALLGGHPLLR